MNIQSTFTVPVPIACIFVLIATSLSIASSQPATDSAITGNTVTSLVQSSPSMPVSMVTSTSTSASTLTPTPASSPAGQGQGYSEASAQAGGVDNATAFSYYVPGLYGPSCSSRIMAWLAANNITAQSLDDADVSCACYGICVAPLAPNPAAAAWFNAYKTNQQLQALIAKSPFVAFTALATLVGVIGNLMAFCAIMAWLPHNVTNIYLASQCVSDFIVIAFSPTFRIVQQTTYIWSSGLPGCIIAYCVRDMSLITSSLNMAGLSVERFVAICYPMKAKSFSSNSKAYKMIGVIWTVALALGVWRAMNMRYLTSVSQCINIPTPSPQSRAFFGIRWVGVYTLPLIMMTICYTCVCISLRRSLYEHRRLIRASASLGMATRNSDTSPTSADVNSVKNNQEKEIADRIKVIRLLVVVVVKFAICWGPIVTVETYVGFTAMPIVNTNMTEGFFMMSYFNSALNPIIYGLLAEPYRLCYQRIVCCHLCRGKSLNLSPHQSHASAAPDFSNPHHAIPTPQPSESVPPSTSTSSNISSSVTASNA